MSKSWVVDASVSIALLFGLDGASDCERAIAGADVLHAPDHLLLEVASAGTRFVRHGVIRADEIEGLLRKARAMIDQFTPSTDLIDAAYALSLKHGFVPYDAVYLVLAQREACGVLTRGQRLVRGCAGAGLGELIQAV